MKMDRRLLLVFVVLAAAALACQIPLPASSDQVQEQTPADQSIDNSILFEDDFSDPNSGWDDSEDEAGITGYRDGGYRILIEDPNMYFWSNLGFNYSDVVIEVDAKMIGGPELNEFGVICRYKDDENFYFFTITSDGYYSISKVVNGEDVFIGTDEMLFNDKAIKLGSVSNHIKASCVGNHLTLEVNGTTLSDVTDSDLSGGDVGLIASTFETPGTDILFDNFIVKRP